MIDYPSASPEEIRELKKLVKKVEVAMELPQQEPPITSPLPTSDPPAPRQYKKVTQKTFDTIGSIEPVREPLKFDNPVVLLNVLKPELVLYRWQYEELLVLAGYLNGKHDAKVEITDRLPLLRTLSAANGSGKDLVVIAGFALWLALTGLRNRVIITSSSFEQTKYQTEIHINEFVRLFNARFGKMIHSIQFHHIIPALGSEIKLFATDEPGRAEGWHPFFGGKMAIILNEAKTIREELFEAVDRCTGYSHLLYVSSPGMKRGRMYKSSLNADLWPHPVVPGRFSYRKVTAYECPHIPQSHIDRQIYIHGADSSWVASSINAEFSDYEESVVIPELIWDNCLKANVAEQGDDIGIGLDLSGGGDELYCYVRKGNRVIFSFGCHQKDTTIAIDFIDKQLMPWKHLDYVFRADNGGIGQAMIDSLRKLGWRVRRCNNQSPAFKKNEFLNLGAEMYFYVKRLVARYDIILPTDPKLRRQITTRLFDGEESKQGKYALQPKKQAISEGFPSPDRADAFVLTFASYTPRAPKPVEKPDEEKSYTIEELLVMERRGTLFAKRALPISANFSQMIKI